MEPETGRSYRSAFSIQARAGCIPAPVMMLCNVSRGQAGGFLAHGHFVSASAHPLRQLQQAVLAHPVGQRVSEPAYLDGVVEQLPARPRRNRRHDFVSAE